MEVGVEAVEPNPSRSSAAKDQRKMDGGGAVAARRQEAEDLC